MACCAPRRGG
uniref:Uncharacterized protein n=1 Tax=Arundo donax TaxID=35708 RepID=A0A0A9KLE5_ARUDO